MQLSVAPGLHATVDGDRPGLDQGFGLTAALHTRCQFQQGTKLNGATDDRHVLSPRHGVRSPPLLFGHQVKGHLQQLQSAILRVGEASQGFCTTQLQADGRANEVPQSLEHVMGVKSEPHMRTLDGGLEGLLGIANLRTAGLKPDFAVSDIEEHGVRRLLIGDQRYARAGPQERF